MAKPNKPVQRRGKIQPADSLLNLVNASGFAFQLAIEETVRITALEERHGWSIVSREHGWNDGGTPRFIDLVLQLAGGPMYLVVECKRPRGGEWVFLVPDPPKGRRAEPRRHFRAQHLRKEQSAVGPQVVTSLYNFQLDPPSWESTFCTIRGTSEQDRPMLDRLCADLTRSADALLEQQSTVGGGFHPSQSWVAIPVIVTTARLHVCRFDPGVVSLHDGLLPPSAGDWQEVPAVRYRKGFAAVSAENATTLGGLEKAAQRTVAIVTGTHLVEWLESLSLQKASYA
jgi:hypothetical protein